MAERRARVDRMTAPEGSFAAAALPQLDAAYNLALWLVRDASAAEDVVQTAMVRALGYFETFRGENTRAWLLQIVRNTAYTWLAERRRGPQPLAEGAEEQREQTPDSADDPEVALARSQDRERLAKMLAQLPPELRECIVLRELEEMSYQQISEVTRVPIGTVMSRLWRARRILIKEVERSKV